MLDSNWLRVGLTLTAACALSCDPPAPVLPAPAGPCPTFSDGVVVFSAGGVEKPVRLYFDANSAAAQDGPLVVLFSGWFADVGLAPELLHPENLQRITDMGGVVAELPSYPFADYGALEDVAEQVVACAHTTLRIDARRVHVAGVGPGAHLATRFSQDRSYVASIAVDRGADASALPTGDHKFAALVTYWYYLSPEGDGQSAAAARAYYEALAQRGHYTMFCGKHTPESLVAATRFFFDHPYGTSPSPYASILPPQPYGTKPVPDVSGLPAELSRDAGYICPAWAAY